MDSLTHPRRSVQVRAMAKGHTTMVHARRHDRFAERRPQTSWLWLSLIVAPRVGSTDRGVLIRTFTCSIDGDRWRGDVAASLTLHQCPRDIPTRMPRMADDLSVEALEMVDAHISTHFRYALVEVAGGADPHGSRSSRAQIGSPWPCSPPTMTASGACFGVRALLLASCKRPRSPIRAGDTQGRSWDPVSSPRRDH
jgi:hypothetical protein